MVQNPGNYTVSPHRYTMCHRGNSRYGQGAGRKHMNLCLRPASAILIDVNRSCASCRSFQASTDKILYFQGFAGFHRVCRKLPNFPESIENTGQNVFFDFVGGSSQTFAAEVGSSRSNIVGVKICCLWEMWRQCDLHRCQTIEKLSAARFLQRRTFEYKKSTGSIE